MGNIISWLSCDAFAKYVCNDASFHSRCCTTCCEMDVVTHATEIPTDSDSVDADCCLGTVHAKT